MKRKKNFALYLIVGLIGLSTLFSCNNTRKTGKVVINPEEIHLVVWESLGGPDDFIKQAGKAFTEKNPHIIIDYVNVESNNSYAHMVQLAADGVGSDLFVAPHDNLGNLVSNNLVIPTKNQSVVENSVLGACSQALTYNGTMYGYPLSAETYALFYNKNLISESEVPTTWQDLEKFVQKFNAENPNKYGFVMDIKSSYYGILFTTANNNRLFGASGTDSKNTNMNNANAVSGLTYLQSLRDSLGLQTLDLSTASCDGLFSSGNAAMHITGVWNVNAFEKKGINFGVAPIPALPGENQPAASFSGTRGIFVSSYSKHPDEASAFAEFLISPEMQQLRFKLTGAMPSINTTVDSKCISGFLKQLDYAFPMPSIPQMDKFWTAMDNAILEIWNGADVQTTMDKCNDAIVK